MRKRGIKHIARSDYYFVWVDNEHTVLAMFGRHFGKSKNEYERINRLKRT